MKKQFVYSLALSSMLMLGSCSGPAEEKQIEEAVPERENTAATVGNETSPAEVQGADMQAARDAFAQQYPQASNVEWEIDDNGYHEAVFEQDGDKYRADYGQDGAWIETESSLDYNELPEAVQKAVEADYDKDNIAEIERVDNAEKGQFYDVEFKDKGKNKDVEYRENGELLNQ